MEKTAYKWRVTFKGSPSFGEYFIEPLPEAKYLDSTYLHKPGDIDYSPLSRLSTEKKTEILYYIANGANPEGVSSCAVDVATCILVDQISCPGFLPHSLNPFYWD